MNDIQFFQTRMGRQYYEVTMPELVREIHRMNYTRRKQRGIARFFTYQPGAPQGAGNYTLFRLNDLLGLLIEAKEVEPQTKAPRDDRPSKD